MILAGARPTPGPFPEIGKLLFTELDLRFDSTDEKVKVVNIERAVTPTKSVILTVPREKVRGVLVVKDKNVVETMDGSWHLGPDVQHLRGEMWGIAYVERNANVVVNIEYSCCLDEFDGSAELDVNMLGDLEGLPITC
jgi:hypothetical protein